MRKRLLSAIASPATRDLLSSTSVSPACALPELGALFSCRISRGIATIAEQSHSQTTCSRTATNLPYLACKDSLYSMTKGFTTFASRWQESTATPSGLNPLMQTPGPTFQLPTPEADSAAPPTAQAVLRKTKISPKKLNEFAKLVRRLHIDDALVQCQVAPNKAAKLCYKLLLSARDNAVKDKGLDADKLRVDRAFVGKGRHLKRVSMHARGRSATRLKYHAHLTIILAEGPLKRITQFRPPNAQWHVNRRPTVTFE